MARNNKSSVFTSKKGDVYAAKRSGGKIKVTTSRTAPGQNLVVGIFDTKTKKWHNDILLPGEVRKHIETKFSN